MREIQVIKRLMNENLKTVKYGTAETKVSVVRYKPDILVLEKTFKHESLILAQDERWRRA